MIEITVSIADYYGYGADTGMVQPYKESGVVMVSEILTLSISLCLSLSLTSERDHEIERYMGTVDNCLSQVYGLEPGRFNCDMLFNMLCQYGNVNKVDIDYAPQKSDKCIDSQVLFMRSKPDTAMVEMGSGREVSTQILFINIRNAVLTL